MVIEIRLRFNVFFSVTLTEPNLPNTTQTNNVKLQHIFELTCYNIAFSRDCK